MLHNVASFQFTAHTFVTVKNMWKEYNKKVITQNYESMTHIISKYWHELQKQSEEEREEQMAAGEGGRKLYLE